MTEPATPHVIDPVRILAFDCETHLIRPGLLAPPLVCASFAAVSRTANGWTPSTGRRNLLHRLSRREILETLLDACLDPHCTLVGANTPFDAAVCMEYAEDLVEPFLIAYAEGRVLDVQLNEKLADIARGRLGGSYGLDGVYSKRTYSLAALVKIHLGKDRDAQKSDPNGWRMRYAELHNVPIGEWPADASAYAIEDADDTLDVLLAQLPDHSWHADAAAKARAFFSLHLLSCHGIMTDADAINALENATAGRFAQLTGELTAEGLIRSNGVRDTKKAKARIVAAYRAHGVPVPLTDTGEKTIRAFMKEATEVGNLAGLSRTELATVRRACVDEAADEYAALDEEACDGSGDPVLEKYAERTRLATIVQTHIPDLRKGLISPIQARWDLAESGRITCSKGKGGSLNGFQLTNPIRSLVLTCERCGGLGMRHGPAVTCRHCKGKGELVGPGVRECFRARPGTVLIDADFSGLELCTVAQACVVLVGYSTLGDALNAGIDVHLDFGAQLLGIDYPEAVRRKHDKDVKEARQLAKVANFGFPGGLGAEGFVAFARGYGIKGFSLERAKELRERWLERWTEFRAYFAHIRNLCDELGVAQVVQLYSHRVRGLVPYTAACNTYFQGLGADGALAALWEVTAAAYGDRESALYGVRPVNFVHDQILAEAPIERAHDAAVELGRVMVDACNRYLPDVPVRCEPCLSYAWHKDAVAVFDAPAGGRLVPWDAARDARARVWYSDGQAVQW